MNINLKHWGFYKKTFTKIAMSMGHCVPVENMVMFVLKEEANLLSYSTRWRSKSYKEADSN